MAEFAKKGSRRWLQLAIARHPELLAVPLRAALGLSRRESIDWRSPLAENGFREYRDAAALRAVDIQALTKRPLSSFWPPRGPVWDALGVAGRRLPIFVEAKAHIPEAASSPTAASESSKRLIDESLAEARRYFAPKATASWSGTFY